MPDNPLLQVLRLRLGSAIAPADGSAVAPVRRTDPSGLPMRAVMGAGRLLGGMAQDARAHPLDFAGRALNEPYDWARSAWDAGQALGNRRPGEMAAILAAAALPGIPGAMGTALGREAGAVEREAVHTANPFAHLPEPPRVYHGTGRAFDSFDPDTFGATSGLDVPAYWFTDDSRFASDYARDAGQRAAGPANVRPARIAMAHPLEYDVMAEGRRAAEELGMPSPETPQEAWSLLSGDGAFDLKADLVQRAHGAGHDGLVIRGMTDNTAPGAPHRTIDAYLALDPKQIRSPWGDWRQAGQVGALVAALGLGGAATSAAHGPAPARPQDAR